jgi:primosomal protein N' (replication factor Y)
VPNAEQVRALALIGEHADRYAAIVVHGVTGSGKTEVYLEAIARCRARRRQALVLVPEIALTEHLVQRFRARFGADVGLMHSALGARERALTWNACRSGENGVLIGTRSAVWVPFPALGLIVVDEEHDASYKQQDGFRYSARDVAIVRARRQGCPVVLGSATPALETLANVRRRKYLHTRLAARANQGVLPRIECIDVRGLALRAGMSAPLVDAVREHLDRGEQAMLFLNRRGYAPLLICRHCGAPQRCTRCDAFMVYHKAGDRLHCHHCGSQRAAARAARCCAAPDPAHIGLGTERIEECVAELFPDARRVRVDRDAMRRRGALQDFLAAVAEHRVDILIGTQMVAKGLDFADITLVGIIDADSRLYSVDFRAEERLAQLLVQVAGRAGRARKPGRVLIQTHHPQHPVLRRVVDEGYERYALHALAQRRAAGLPPYSALAIVRAESAHPTRAFEFLARARKLLAAGASPQLELSFPIAAALERRAGRHRALIVLTSRRRAEIGRVLAERLPELEEDARRARVRWSLDVDPQDTL